jgi:hypothetical protein
LPATNAPAAAGAAASSTCTTVISSPWSAPAFPSVKGVLHQPEAKPTLKQETRDAILVVVAKARSWIDDVASGCVRSFAEIAEREGKVERHIRLLTPLAFIPPRALAAIIDGTGPHDATVTALAQAVPYRWDHSPNYIVDTTARLALESARQWEKPSMSGEPVGAEDKNPEIKVTPEMVEAGIAALEEYLLDGELIRGLRPEAAPATRT